MEHGSDIQITDQCVSGPQQNPAGGSGHQCTKYNATNDWWSNKHIRYIKIFEFLNKSLERVVPGVVMASGGYSQLIP